MGFIRPCPMMVVIAGPNGTGKTTISREVLSRELGIDEFVNADTIAAGLSGFNPEKAAFAAGRLMLKHLHELPSSYRSFAFESTLSSRTFAPLIRQITRFDYEFHLVYVWVKSPHLAIRRVRKRVRLGGHHVPDEVVIRRYYRSCWNVQNLYMPLASTWRIYDNSGSVPDLIATGGHRETTKILEERTFEAFKAAADVQSNEKNSENAE